MTEKTQIYLMTPPQIPDLQGFAVELEAVCQAQEIASLQIRLKDVDDDEIARVFAKLAPIARAHGAVVILNDNPHLALELGADGVHLGQSDMAVKAARKLLGSDMVIGATAHNSRHLAMCAAEDGADYVAFGAFFPTATKKTEFVATTDLLQWWVEMMEIPCVAIGGITPENVSPLVKAGADFVCLSSGIWTAADGSIAAINDLAKQLDI